MTLGASRRGLGLKAPPTATLALAHEIPKRARDARVAELIAIATLRVDNTHVLGEFLNESHAVGKKSLPNAPLGLGHKLTTLLLSPLH